MTEPLLEQLARARQTGQPLAEPHRLSLSQGYRIAARLAPMLGETVGWKVGATSPGAQSVLGVRQPIRGRVFRSGLLLSPADFAPQGDRACEAEPEIVLESGPEPGVAARAFLGIEVNRPSRDDALALGPGFIVADNAAHVALVVGPEIPLELLSDPAAIRVILQHNGEPAGQGSADAVLGDPRQSLTWLAGRVDLRPGELVASGAITRAVPFGRGDTVVACFGPLGRVTAHWPERSEVMPVRRK